MSWVVVLAGATLTAMLPAYRYAEGKPIAGRDFVDALLVLSVLARAQVEAGRCACAQISDQLRLMPHRCEAVLERAARLGWTARTEKDGWVLARDAELLPVAEIYKAFAFDAETWRHRAELGPRAHPAANIPPRKRHELHSARRAPDRRARRADAAEARALVEKLGDAARFYKIGLELFTAGGYFELLGWLTARGNKVFADLKLYDIPETVRRAVANLRGRGATFLTVHGHRSVMEAAAREKGDMKILAVTVLTSFDQRDLEEMGSTPQRRAAGARARARRGRERLRRRDLLGARGAGAEERSSGSACWW